MLALKPQPLSEVHLVSCPPFFFFINFTPLFVVVYSDHNMIIFLCPTFNLFAHVSGTCNSSMRGKHAVREIEKQNFSLASISPLVSVRIYFHHELSHKIANQLRSFCPAVLTSAFPVLYFFFRRVRHFRFPHYTNGRSFLFNNMRYYCNAPFVQHVCVGGVELDWDLGCT